MLLRKIAVLNYQKCVSCRECPAQDKCPSGAIKREEDGYLFVDLNCSGCRKCARACPYQAITVN